MPVSSSPDSAPVSVRRDNTMGGGCVIAFCSIFFFIGLALMINMVGLPMYRWATSSSWVSVPCRITASQLTQSKGSKSTTYRFDVAYSYTYSGQNYIGDQLSFGPVVGSSYNSRLKYQAAYPLNSTTTCYVNPANPNQAVLQRGLGGDAWFGLTPLIFVLVGGGGMILGWKGLNPSHAKRESWQPKSMSGGLPTQNPRPVSKTSNQSGPPAPSVFDSGPFQTLDNSPGAAPAYSIASAVDIAPTTPDGAITLKANSSPIARVFGTFFLAAFWNGIVSIFLYQLVNDAMRGKFGFMNIFLGLFLIPFVLIGLVLIGAFFSQVLAFFNARSVVTLSRAALRPGEAAEIGWQLRGGLMKPTSVKWTLEGREEATYRRGTDTVTDKSIFHQEVLFDAPILDGQRGAARITVPADTMHSFEARNNKIVWTLKLHGPINVWPDLQEEYKIVVNPPRSNP